MAETDKYKFESFEAGYSEFDSQFTSFLNSKYDSGWKYKSCNFNCQGDKLSAYCLFKKHD